MADDPNSGADREGPAGGEDVARRAAARAHGALVGVSVAYFALVWWRTAHDAGPTFDEVVYASQVARGVPPAMFSAARAWGMPLLLAPVALITSSFVAIRVYLTVLSGVLLYAAFRPWLRVFAPRQGLQVYAPAVAAGLFASLWPTVLYGAMAYPNVWITLFVVMGAGYCVRALLEPAFDWRLLAGVFVAFGVASLIRPSDALAAAVPMLLFGLVAARGWRRVRGIAALAGGLAVGWTPWIIEAYERFGGPLDRLQSAAHGSQGGRVFTLGGYFVALDGPALACNPPSVCAGIEPSATIWWIALPVLVAIGLVAAARRDRWLPLGLAVTASGLAVAAPYLFLLGIVQPRYLLPAYGLLFLPGAAGLLWLVDRPGDRARAIAAAAAVAAVVGHIAVQQGIFEVVSARLLRTLRNQGEQTALLRDEMGVAPPCLFWGEGAIPAAYELGCRSHWAKGRAPADDDGAIRAAIARGETVVVKVAAKNRPPALLSGWREITPRYSKSYRLYVSPRAAP
jgi:hypothetical protein